MHQNMFHIVEKFTTNKSKGRNGWVPDTIVNHITEGSYDGAVNWLLNPLSNVSAHFVVAKDGRITQLVPLTDTAFCNGTTNAGDRRDNHHSEIPHIVSRKVNANYYTISIENEGFHGEAEGALPPTQLKANIWLTGHIIREVERLYGKQIPICRNHIIGHSCVTPLSKPNCPGNAFPYMDIIAALRDAPNEWAREAWEWGIQKGITDGNNPKAVASREMMVALMYNFAKAM